MYTEIKKRSSYTIPEFINSKYALDLIIPYSGDKWLQMNPSFGGGILVHNERSTESRYLNTADGNGNLPSNIVNDMILGRGTHRIVVDFTSIIEGKPALIFRQA